MLSQLSYTPIFFHTLWSFYYARSLICFQPEVFFIELVFSATLLDWFVFNPKFVDTHLCSFCTHTCSFSSVFWVCQLWFIFVGTFVLFPRTIFKREWLFLSFYQTNFAISPAEALGWWAQVLSSLSPLYSAYTAFLRSVVFSNFLTPATLRVAWWAQVDSNHRPHAYQACALTTWAMSPYLYSLYMSHRSKDIEWIIVLNMCEQIFCRIVQTHCRNTSVFQCAFVRYGVKYANIFVQ